jgi:hypothetical protein
MLRWRSALPSRTRDFLKTSGSPSLTTGRYPGQAVVSEKAVKVIRGEPELTLGDEKKVVGRVVILV